MAFENAGCSIGHNHLWPAQSPDHIAIEKTAGAARMHVQFECALALWYCSINKCRFWCIFFYGWLMAVN